MAGLQRSGTTVPLKKQSMRPPNSRPSTARTQSSAPVLNARTQSGTISPAESVASLATSTSRSPARSRPNANGKRKERDFEGEEETNIHVVVRCRGRNEREVRENSGVVLSTDGVQGKNVELSMGPSALSNKTYHFDKVFSPAADQAMIFDDVVTPLLDEVCRVRSPTNGSIIDSVWADASRLQLHHLCIRPDGNRENVHHVRRYVGEHHGSLV